MSHGVRSNRCNVILRQPQRTAYARVQSFKFLNADEANTINCVRFYKSRTRFTGGDHLCLNAQGGVGPGRLGEIFDGGADPLLSFDKQHIARLDRARQKHGICRYIDVRRARWARQEIRQPFTD